MPGGLVHNVIRNILGTPEARLQLAGPQATALFVFKVHHHPCIINWDLCAGSIPDARIGVEVADEPHRSRAIEYYVCSDRVVNKKYPALSGQPQKKLIAQVDGIGILSKGTDIESGHPGAAVHTLAAGGLAKAQYRPKNPKDCPKWLHHARIGKQRIRLRAAMNRSCVGSITLSLTKYKAPAGNSLVSLDIHEKGVITKFRALGHACSAAVYVTVGGGYRPIERTDESVHSVNLSANCRLCPFRDKRTRKSNNDNEDD